MVEYRMYVDVDWQALDGQMVRVRCLPEGVCLVMPETADVRMIGRVVHHRQAAKASDVQPPVDPETWREGAHDPLFNGAGPAGDHPEEG